MQKKMYMGNLSILYVPCSSKEEARAISTKLLNEKLIACAGIHQAESMYFWKGKKEEGQDHIIFAETLKSKVKEAEKRIKELHSYECPCILSLPIETVNEEYLNWCKGELND